MKHDEKQFLDLLQEYKSDETKKARRNLSTICFIIISAWILKIRFTEMRVFGVDISSSAELHVLLLALVLMAYWLIMFLLSWNHDKEIQKERSLHLIEQVKHFTERFRVIEEKRAKSNSDSKSHDYNEVKAAVDAYRAQEARTKRAAQYGNVVNKLELLVPIILSGAAGVVLAINITNALP
ncbi:MAG: hypothetical protein HZA59_02250 [Hydrogenophilales bacterium]|nr:hypothetical protein [Hydrogenophilales bacterium]